MISAITTQIVSLISSSGYFGIGLLMAIESAAIPVPSEIIMPFGGYLVAVGQLSLFGVALAGAVGSVVGSAILYAIGFYGGRPLIERYGKYILLRHKDLDRADRFFQKYGEISNFIGRMLPIVRTYISFPAGVTRINFKKFLLGSFIGSFIWSYLLAYVGMKLGQNWDTLRGKWHSFDLAIIVLIVLGLLYYLYSHLKKRS